MYRSLFALILFCSCNPNYFTRLAQKFEPYNFREEVKTYPDEDTTAHFSPKDTVLIKFQTEKQTTVIRYYPITPDSAKMEINAKIAPDTVKRVEFVPEKEGKRDIISKEIAFGAFIAFLSLIFVLFGYVISKK